MAITMPQYIRKSTPCGSVLRHASFASMNSLACRVVQTALYTGVNREKLTGNVRSCWCTLFERESRWKFSTFLPRSVCLLPRASFASGCLTRYVHWYGYGKANWLLYESLMHVVQDKRPLEAFSVLAVAIMQYIHNT